MLRVAWIFFAVVTTVVSWCSEAAAARSIVTLDVRPTTRTEVPTHLCVVSEAVGPRTRDRLWDLLRKETDDSDQGRNHWNVLPDAWGARVEAQSSARCSDDPTIDCRPTVELPEGLDKDDELFVACTADTLLLEQAEAANPRVLMILLEQLGGSPPAIDSVRFTGGIATIGIAQQGEEVVVTARSMGGHYLPHRRSYLEESAGHRLVVLPVTPRCQWIDVTLPGTRVAERDRNRLDITVHGAALGVEHCVGELRGTHLVPIQMPIAPGLGTLDVRIRSSEPGGPDARFGARWTGEWPNQPLDLQATQVHFTWDPPACIYPADECPQATLPETGTSCQATPVGDHCEYRCPGDRSTVEPAELELPLRVQFVKDDPKQHWIDTLARNGQTLTGFVPSNEIYLTADVHRWDTDVPASRIDEVRIYGKDGTASNYPIRHVPTVEIPVPYGSCEPVRYRPLGDRRYDHGLATVSDGRIEFGPPQRTARILTFNAMLGLGGGPAWEVPHNEDDTRIYFNGIAQIAARFRPRRPKLARLAVEVRALGTLGQFGFQELELGEVPQDSSFRKIGWARVWGEPALLVDATHRLAFSAATGFGASFPIRREEDLQADLVSFVVSPALDVRFKVTSRFSFVLQVRGFIERGAEVTTDETGNDSQSVDKFTAATLMTLAAAELNF